jgi:hypothetical protein
MPSDQYPAAADAAEPAVASAERESPPRAEKKHLAVEMVSDPSSDPTDQRHVGAPESGTADTTTGEQSSSAEQPVRSSPERGPRAPARPDRQGILEPRTLAVGGIEFLDHQTVVGWAWYRPTPDEPIEVEILVDDVVVLKVRADEARPELLESGAGNGKHGFSVPELGTHIPLGTHTVRVRRARDRLDIPGSPRKVTRPGWDGENTESGSREADGLEWPPPGDAGRGNIADVPDLALFEAMAAGTIIPTQPRDDGDAAMANVAAAAVPAVDPGEAGTNSGSPATDRSHGPARSEDLDGGHAPERRMLAVGGIDSIDYRHILGWAWYRPTPDKPIEIEVLVDDVVVLETRAELARPELAEVGAGNGRHGFFVHNLASFMPVGTHIVRVRRARDRLDLPGSPARITRPDEGLSVRGTGIRQRRSCWLR